MARRLWNEWLRLARQIGNFNARALITLVYFILMLPFGLISRLFSDPLDLNGAERTSSWQARQTNDLDLDRATRQG